MLYFKREGKRKKRGGEEKCLGKRKRWKKKTERKEKN
jgi:hypothetical protein